MNNALSAPMPGLPPSIWALFKRSCTWVMLMCVVLLQACAGISTSQNVWHAFEFNGKWDGWADTVDLLEYDYGGKYNMVRDSITAPAYPSYKNKQLPHATLINGPMPVGEYLYVKWRVRATGEVREERIDLRSRLPFKMKDQKLTFVIDQRDLYVYIVSDQLKSKDKRDGGLKTRYSKPYHDHVVYEIYPNLNRPQN